MLAAESFDEKQMSVHEWDVRELALDHPYAYASREA
jgi:hypothetical protein